MKVSRRARDVSAAGVALRPRPGQAVRSLTTYFADIASGSPSGSQGRGPTAAVLLGPPGSGKGTLGRTLGQLTGWPHIAAGDLLRGAIRESNPGPEGSLAAQLAQGNFAPDAMIQSLLRERLLSSECQRGFLLDGFPRNTAQADTLLAWVREFQAAPILIHLHVEYNEMVVRLNGRRLCPDCGAIYHCRFRPPAREEVCDFDGVRLTVRSDDSETVLAHRWEVFESLTRPVLDIWERQGLPLTRIDTTRLTPESVVEMAKTLPELIRPQALQQAR